MAKTKIAVIGASSMVGSRFCELSADNFELVQGDLHGQNQIDIIDRRSVDNFFQNHNFDWLILFSAYTDVDGAEKQRNDKTGISWKINVDGVKNIVAASKKYGRKLIFISTDFVFEGTSGPYPEDAPAGQNPRKISWYGLTKVEGENIVLTSLPDSIILRIAYPYRGKFEEKDDIAKRFLKLYRDQKMYPVFADQIITPTFIDDLAPAVKLLIAKGESGIFHLVSPLPTTQFDFARKVIEVFGGDPNVVPKGSIIDFLKKPGITPRPIKGGLKVDKIKKLGFTPTSWDKGLEIVFRQSKGQLI
ncbi:NAD(P)-dependent oxidoreductase [Candidatus Curtissbacteria bacterium]|nr:NAD(P)-dependent oxidoreductase [Candidatus Curtissbacteria bacterium]